ncbi:cytochrome c-type biogenesis protein [Yoonia litorea]|uniref:Cytochrome c-type biogenesis protein n=1 Tax=Yoonia litorea TaxID=1123755 RepID=A0A1I6N3B0_9RHOB|nr:cytochrome c-type biogenesis protein [Yoonia litorea]SFS22384.1 cytochrome c-type biogenesis protein CcmH [Yoonia litorea]
MKLLATIILLLIPMSVFAVEPDEILQDPMLEQRAREISKELRCVVCQNQDIDSSNAGVARDLRILVRERLVAGDTDEEVISYIHARYGDYVLMRPPFNATTAALWLAPFILAAVSLLIGWWVLSTSRKRRTSVRLSAKEEAEVARYIEAKKAGEP